MPYQKRWGNAMPDEDTEAARLLLGGFVKADRHKWLHQKYLKERSAAERDARRAMATLLRSNRPLDRQLRASLADLFDPDDPLGEKRCIKICRRHGGRQVDQLSKTQIASEVAANVKRRAGVTRAIQNVAEDFSLSDERVKQIWREYRWAFQSGVL
jgi:hypothetical protein